MIIGLCGRSGSGKSTVAALFGSFGAEVFDCDKISREVTEKGSECLKELETVFGADIIKPDGTLDRHRLSDIVVNTSSFDVLNSVTHKHILSRLFEKIEKSKSEIKVIDAPLLFETHLEEKCDIVIAVVCDENISALRASKRDGVTSDTVIVRRKHQKSDEFLRENADIIIENNGSSDELKAKAKLIYERITDGE